MVKFSVYLNRRVFVMVSNKTIDFTGTKYYPTLDTATYSSRVTIILKLLKIKSNDLILQETYVLDIC